MSCCFRNALVPISVGRPKSIAAVQHAKNTGSLLGIVMQRDERVDDPGREALCDVGTMAKVVQYVDSEEQLRHALCQGVKRFRIESMVEGYPFLAARVQLIEEPAELSTQAEALGLQLRERAAEILSLLPGAPAELAHTLQAVNVAVASGRCRREPAGHRGERQADAAGNASSRRSGCKRCCRCCRTASRCCGCRRKSASAPRSRWTIRSANTCCASNSRRSRRSWARKRATARTSPSWSELITKAGMPADVEAQARKELARLQRMPDASSEYSMLRTYLEWMTELPWAVPPASPIDLAEARRILEADHYGLERIKQRIVEYLAVQKLNPRGARRFCALSGRRAWARPRWARASRMRWGGRSCAFRWAACMTKPRFAATAALISAPCRA